MADRGERHLRFGLLGGEHRALVPREQESRGRIAFPGQRHTEGGGVERTARAHLERLCPRKARRLRANRGHPGDPVVELVVDVHRRRPIAFQVQDQAMEHGGQEGGLVVVPP
jgi:hypothetical protein